MYIIHHLYFGITIRTCVCRVCVVCLVAFLDVVRSSIEQFEQLLTSFSNQTLHFALLLFTQL